MTKYRIVLLVALAVSLCCCQQPNLPENPQINTKVSTPVIEPTTVAFPSKIVVSISCATPSSIIHYTDNGNVPDGNSAVYAGPFIITDTRVIKAIATKSGYIESDIASSVFTKLSPLFRYFDTTDSLWKDTQFNAESGTTQVIYGNSGWYALVNGNFRHYNTTASAWEDMSFNAENGTTQIIYGNSGWYALVNGNFRHYNTTASAWEDMSFNAETGTTQIIYGNSGWYLLKYF